MKNANFHFQTSLMTAASNQFVSHHVGKECDVLSSCMYVGAAGTHRSQRWIYTVFQIMMQIIISQIFLNNLYERQPL